MRAVLAVSTLALAASPAFAAVDPGMVIAPKTLLPSDPQACSALLEKTAQRGQASSFKRLDQLPRALLEHTVMRRVDGCPVREVVYQGQTWLVAPPTAKP